MRKILSQNPFNHKFLKEFDFLSDSELNKKLSNAYLGYQRLKDTSIMERKFKINKLGDLIYQNQDKFAQLISTEMGKPIKQAVIEVRKAANHCKYYSDNAEKFLLQKQIKTEAKKSFIAFEPIGPIYIISPFNFSFWLVFKPAIPNLLLGNSVIVRTSDSTPLIGLAIEELMKSAEFGDFEYQNVLSSQEQLDQIMESSFIRGVSFTGSSRAGRIIAASAGKNLKKSVMELGGSDPFLVLKDSDPKFAAQVAYNARIPNAGQVCCASKRFLIPESLFDEFSSQLIKLLENIKIGDPLDINTDMGPMARPDLLENIKYQVNKGLSEGNAQILWNGNDKLNFPRESGNFYAPIVIEVTEKDNSLFQDEVFGPVFCLFKYKDLNQAIEIANDTQFGLGGTIVGKDKKEAEEIGRKIEAGSLFINSAVKSDSRLPSGGIKNSGFGRECGKYGLLEFANIKTYWIEDQE